MLLRKRSFCEHIIICYTYYPVLLIPLLHSRRMIICTLVSHGMEVCVCVYIISSKLHCIKSVRRLGSSKTLVFTRKTFDFTRKTIH